MRIVIVKSIKEVVLEAVDFVFKEIWKKPNLVLGLATGKTMIPFYKELVLAYKNSKIDFSEIKSFNLDEYLGFNEDDKKSLRYFMDINLFNKINIKKENIHFLNGSAKNIELECRNYEKEIKKTGGIDLQILGIGRNGHIGFNEPGSSFKSKTRKVKLSDTTLRDNKVKIKYALTMGLATIMQAKKIILLANGKHKADAIAAAIRGNVNEKVPASILKKHKDATFIIDKYAASKL